jgi:hypothetical protein
MNAAISAAHARQQGAGLDIIAQNIHIVAEEATGHALALARGCETITRHATHLQDVERETQTRVENIGRLLDDARERMTTLEANGTKLMVLAADVERAAAGLSGDVNGVAKTIDVKADFLDKLAPVLKQLDVLGATINEEMTESDSVNLEVLFGDLEHCYTMDSERRIHRQFIDKDDPSSSGMISDVDEWSASRDHGLGDNVDLF